MSNILDVLNPPKSRDLDPEEYQDCLPCQIMATVGFLSAGVWFASGQVFQNDSLTIEENLKQNPKWWRTSVRTFGIGMIGMGIYRGTEHWLWNKKEEKILDN